MKRHGRWIGSLLLLALGVTILGHAQEAPQPRALRDLEYARPDGKPQLLDLYLPEKADGPLPVIVWIHGGAWLAGSKNGTPALPMLARGYAVASVEYRLSQEATFPAQIHDCKAAIRWLRAHAREYGLDADHFGAWGSSAGGHLVALLGTSGGVKELEGNEGNGKYSSRVQAVCDWFGPSDFLHIGEYPSTLHHDAPDSPEGRLLGGAIPQNRDKAAKASPITYVTKGDPPFMIMHGDQDQTVPFNQSERLYQALKNAGVEATFHPIPGAGHGGPGFSTPEVRAMILAFFNRHLKRSAVSTSPR
jgi:acetyl esterase/lipase